MSLSEARRLADDPDAIASAPEARLASALWSLSGREASPDDGARRLRLSSEMVSRLWAERPTSHPTQHSDRQGLAPQHSECQSIRPQPLA